MPRKARKLSNSNIYHIVFRGINRQNIFLEDYDYQKILDKLQELKNELKFEIYAYCLMSNHAHILIKEKNSGDISLILKRLLISYAIYFNKKYQRIGKVINDRYLSIAVEKDSYLLNLIRYIHQNPLKIGLSLNYKWSSFNGYFNNKNKLLDSNFILNIISREKFLFFHSVEEKIEFEPTNTLIPSDNELRLDILRHFDVEAINLINLEQNKCKMILTSLKNSYSIRQISRVTGISRYIINKLLS